MMQPQDVLKLCKNKAIQFVDLRFMDFPGLWQHVTVPVSELTLESFDNGFGFDGSCIRGWQAINESDMLLSPVADTARVDPFMQYPTLGLICDVRDPITRKEFARDPRSIARKAVAYLQETGIADNANFGPELEFFVFDHAWFDQGINFSKHHVGSQEGIWTRGDESPANNGCKVRLKEGFFPVPPIDTMHNIRCEMVQTLIDGIQNKIDPGPPTDKDIQSLGEEELSQMGSTPDSLEEALDELEKDHDYLLAGNVFPAEVIHYWIKYKRENEVDALRIRPHPYEFCMYFDI